MRRSTNTSLIVIFLGMVGLPLAATIGGIDGSDPAGENRELAAFPLLDGTWSSVRRYPAHLAHWFDDHFAFRTTLVELDALVRLFALESSPSLSVLVGKGGWLFYGEDGALEDIANAPLLSGGEVENWRATLIRADDWLRARGTAFVFTIAPDKHAIYPEQLPAAVRPHGSTSRTDQIFTALGESPLRDRAIDLRPALREAKARARVYHITDTHWNDRGVWAAYQGIIGAVRRQVPAVPPAWPLSDFDAVLRPAAGGDLAGMVGLKRVLREERLALVPRRARQAQVVEPRGAALTDEEGLIITEIPGSMLPRAVIFRDSFVSPLVPFLSEHFSRAVYLWQNDVLPDDVLRERPDVVIYEIVGRHLYTFTPSQELIPD